MQMRMTLIASGILMAGVAMAQTEEPMSAAPEVLSEDTPEVDQAKPEAEGFESMESVEVDDGQLPPPAGPEVSDDTPPTGSAEPELEGYQSMESVEVDDGQLPPPAGPEVSADGTPLEEPVEVEPEGYKSKDSVATD